MVFFNVFKTLTFITFFLFTVLIENGYHSNNPYHNALHAADVTQAMHCYLQLKQVLLLLKMLKHKVELDFRILIYLYPNELVNHLTGAVFAHSMRNLTVIAWINTATRKGHTLNNRISCSLLTC